MEYRIQSTSKVIPIFFGFGELDNLDERIELHHADKVIIITDSNVEGVYGKAVSKLLTGYEYKFFVFPAGESSKNFVTYESLCNQILTYGITKKSLVIALGGGVVGNIAGFVAATLFRGIRFIQIPTTVMAQADSSSGGKQAINTFHGKNTIGVFYEPESILIDPSFLTTLPKDEIRSGIAECIKHFFCQKPELLVSVRTASYEANKLSQIIQDTIGLKCTILDQDRNEKTIGKSMLYGHTVGHAIELLALSKGFPMSHGDAISIGMCVAARISIGLGISQDPQLLQEHEQIFTAWGLPIKIPSFLSIDEIIQQLKYDKKFMDSEIEFVLLKSFGAIAQYSGSYSIPVGIDMLKKTLIESY